MKKTAALIIIIMLAVTLSAWAEVAAKPEIKALFIQHQNMEDFYKFFLCKDDLINGKVVVEILTNNDEIPTSKVEVSLDGGATWADAGGKDGRYLFAFVPQEQEYRVTARAVAAEDQVSRNYSKILMSYYTQTNVDMVRQMMLDLAQAYQNKDKKAFMAFISQDYQGNYDNLRDLIQLNFDQLYNINFKIYVNNVVVSKDRATVEFTWERQAFNNDGTAANITPSGTSIFTLIKDKQWLVLQGAGNEIFGIAQQQGITSTVTPDNPQGNIPFIAEGTTTLNAPQGFIFASQAVVDNTNPSRDILFEGQMFVANTNGGIQESAASNLNDIDQAPSGGYQFEVFNLAVGNCYILQTSDGKYAKLQITAYNPFNSVTIHWIYQPSGSRNF